MATKQETAEDTYARDHYQAREVVAAIAAELWNLPAPGDDSHPITWGHVGELGSIRETLDATLEKIQRHTGTAKVCPACDAILDGDTCPRCHYPTRRRQVVLNSGETLDVVAPDDHLGVHTDAGCHAWDQVAAFVVWSKTHEKWMTVPVN